MGKIHNFVIQWNKEGLWGNFIHVAVFLNINFFFLFLVNEPLCTVYPFIALVIVVILFSEGD